MGVEGTTASKEWWLEGMEVIIHLYSVLKKFHLEYCSQVMGPQHKKGIELLEVTKMIRGPLV